MIIGYIQTIVVIAFCQLSRTTTVEINLKCSVGGEMSGEINKILGCTDYRNRIWLKVIQMLPYCNDSLPSTQLPWHLWKNQVLHWRKRSLKLPSLLCKQKCFLYVNISESKRRRDCLCIFRTFLKKRKERTAIIFVSKCCINLKFKHIPCRIILVVDRKCNCSFKLLNRSDSIIFHIMEKKINSIVPNFVIDKLRSSDENIKKLPTSVRLRRAAVNHVIKTTVNSSSVSQSDTVTSTTLVTQKTGGSGETTTQSISTTSSKITTQTNKSIVYQQISVQNNIDAKWGILCIGVIVLIIMFSVQYNRLCQHRRRHHVYVDYLDRLKFVPVKELVHSKAKYLPIFQFQRKKKNFTAENSRRNLSLAVVEEESDDSDY